MTTTAVGTRNGTRRRDFLKLAGLGAVALAAVPFEASATPQGLKEAMDKLIGGKIVKEGKVNVILPDIAEDGGTVPFAVDIDSPMTEADHVKAIHIFADGNPLPDIASYYLGPHNGKAQIAVRIRLGKTQHVVCAAEMSNGDVYVGRRQVKVTLGGCGG